MFEFSVKDQIMDWKKYGGDGQEFVVFPPIFLNFMQI